MLSFGQIYQSLESYDKDNYYVKDSEVETRFQSGSGWQELKVKDGYEINSEDFKNLASGKDLQGNYLSKEFEQKNHRQGFDFVWSPHKSVTLYAFTSKENLKLVTETMNSVTKSLIDFIEREGYIQYRETLDGETISKASDNATVLVNTHLCGRLDPQIHNHISIFNFTRTENGEYKAINSDALYANKYVFEAYLENQLAYQLKQHGISTEFVREGNSKEYVTKIAGLSEEHWKGIARTSELIDQYLSEHKDELLQKYQNATESQLREYAYLEIRQSKQSKTVNELFEQVESALRESGFSKEDIIKLVSEKRESLTQELSQVNKEELAKEIVNKAIDEIIDRHSTFSQSALYKAVFQISAGRVDSDTLVEVVKSNERLIEMGYMQDKQHNRANATYQEKYYTSQEVIAWEHNILKSVEEGKGSVEKITEQRYENEKLTKSQLKAINHILQSTDRYTAIVGWAGVGKTTFVGEMSKELEKINEIAKESGYRLVGISNTNTAVNELREVGIEAMTTSKFLNSARALQSLNDKTILIVDEASFLSTKDMSKIIDKTRESGARIVFIGDDRQLPGVQAGSPFSALVRENKINHVKMTDIIRQRNEELKQAVINIYNKEIESALNKINIKTVEKDSKLAKAIESLEKENTKEELLREISTEYLKQGYIDTVISVATNNNARELNNLINKQLKETELKDSKSLEIKVWINKNLDNVERLKAVNYSVNDKLIVMSSGAGISVGKELYVKEVDSHKNTIKVEFKTRKGETKERIFNIEKLGDKIQAFQSEKIVLSESEKIIFNHTYRDKNFANSEFAYVKKINEDGSIVLINRFSSDKFKTATFSKEEIDKGLHIQHGYAVTADRLQGKTTQNVIAFEIRNYENFLVSISRAKQNATIYTTLTKDQFIEKAKNEVTKERIEKMSYMVNKEVFETVKDQVYEKYQEQQQEREQKFALFVSETLNDVQKEEYQKWAKHFTAKDFKEVQKSQKPSLVKKIATALIDSKYVDRKYRDWLNGKTRDKFEKFSMKDQLKTWWKNNLNRDIEKLTGQKRRDYWKTYEVYTKDKNGQWHKGIQKLHVKVRGKKTTIEGYTLTKDGIYHFTIEKQKGLFGVEKEIDREMKFIAHEQIQKEQREKEQRPKQTYSNEAAAKAKEIIKQQQEKQEQKQAQEGEKATEQKQEQKKGQEKVEKNEKDEAKKYIIQTIEKQGKITNRDVLQWAKENRVKTENAISAMKELNSVGKIHNDKYDEKTKTITYISASKVSEQKRAVEQAIANIYRNTGKEKITIKDIQKELERAKVEISNKTLRKHIESYLGKTNEEGKYDINKTYMANVDKGLVSVYVNSIKEVFTSKEFNKILKKHGHEINEKRLEKYIQEQKDVRIVGFQKNQDGKIEAVYSHKDTYKQNKEEWLKKEAGNVRQKADEQLAKAVIEKSKESKLGKEEIDKKIQETTKVRHKGYAKSLRERIQTQEKMKTQERTQTQEHSRSAAAAEQSQSLGRER